MAEPSLLNGLTPPEDPAHLHSPFQERLRYNAEQLEELLQLWVDCPTQIRSTLSPGIAQFRDLLKEASKYEDLRYPHIFFQHLCSAAILALERGEGLDDQSKSSLLSAWTSVQLSIHLTNDPNLYQKFEPTLKEALEDTGDLFVAYTELQLEGKDKSQEWKLTLDIQRWCCYGTLATLQMLRKLRSRESLASKSRDVDMEIEILANQSLDLRQKKHFNVTITNNETGSGPEYQYSWVS